MNGFRREWPYTTPSGFTYEYPETYKDLCNLHINAGLAEAETWDAAERPPEPVWEMVGIAHREVERLKAELLDLQTELDFRRLADGT